MFHVYVLWGMSMTRVVSARLAALLGAIFCSIAFAFSPAGGFAAGFSVERDAFTISNAPGYCFAMTAFSRWYYLTNPAAPPLRTAIDEKTQECIAKELQQFYSKNLIGIQADYCNRYHGDQTESFRRFLAGVIMGEPRLVLLMKKGRQGAILHAVLAYEWIPEGNILKIYDPNYNDVERVIELDKKEYTSLDVTYHAICFPEVLHGHEGLVRKMQALYGAHVLKRSAAADRNISIRSQ